MAGVFDKVLREGESLFRNEIALDFSFIPKLVEFRENEQFAIANAIKPLFDKRNARNLIITGKPGIGKTVATKHVLRELEEQTDDIYALYVNCWQKNSSYKVALELCDQLNYPLTQNKRTDELLKMIVHIVNKKNAVFVFDEIDKAEEYDFLYTLLEEVFRKSIILITNDADWAASIDNRIRSRLMPEVIDFRPYNGREIEGILRRRTEFAFVPGVWDEEAFMKIVERTAVAGDVRVGLYLLREAGLIAEERASRKIEAKDAEAALSKIGDFKQKEISKLSEEEKTILELAKKKPGCRIGELFKEYQGSGGKLNYKAFQRRVKKLDEDHFISTEKITGGKDGTTTIIHYEDKKLTEF